MILFSSDLESKPIYGAVRLFAPVSVTTDGRLKRERYARVQRVPEWPSNKRTDTDRRTDGQAS